MAGNTKVGVGRKGKSLKSAIEDGTRKSRLNVVKKPAEGNGGKENGGGEKQGKSDIVDKPARGIAGYSGGDFDAVAKERLIT